MIITAPRTSVWSRLAAALRPAFLGFADQGIYLLHTSADQQAVIQLLWLYRHGVDLEALHLVHANLEHGLLARLVQPSILPFGRHHWTSVPPSPSGLAVGADPLAPEALHAWADAQVQLPLDPAHGPGWRLAVQPVSDGATAVSLVVSHCMADGLATSMAVTEAVRGERREPAYSLQNEPRRRATVLLGEVLQFVLDFPSTLRALAQFVGIAARALRTPGPRPAGGGRGDTVPVSRQAERIVSLPSVSVRVNSSAWLARAKRAGVSRTTLLTAMAATWAVALGRVSDGTVSLMIPVNRRTGASDTGGNRVSLATLKVSAGAVGEQVAMVQRTLRSTLLNARRRPDLLAALLPLIPFVPKRLFVSLSTLAFGSSGDLPVSYSHLGPAPPEVLGIDGTAAEWFGFRGVDRHLSGRDIERRRGVATLLSGFSPGYIILNFVAYQPGIVTDTGQLRAIVEQVLADYDLSGEVFFD